MKRLKTMLIAFSLVTTPALAVDMGELFPEVSYNPVRNEFLVTHAKNFNDTIPSFRSTMMLRVYNAAGVLQGGPFEIGEMGLANGYMYWGADQALDLVNERMLVAWQQDDKVRATLVDLKNNVVLSHFSEVAAATGQNAVGVAFSPSRQKYLVAWIEGSGTVIRGRYVLPDGTYASGTAGDAFDILTGGSSLQKLKVRYAAGTDSFLVGYNHSTTYDIKVWSPVPPTVAAAGVSMGTFSAEPDFMVDAANDPNRVLLVGTQSGPLSKNALNLDDLSTEGLASLSATADSSKPVSLFAKENDLFFTYTRNDAGPPTAYFVEAEDEPLGTMLQLVNTPSSIQEFDAAYNDQCGAVFAVYNVPSGDYVLDKALQGNQCMPQISATPSSLNFGQIATTTSFQTFSIMAKLASLTVQSIALAGSDPTSFVLNAAGCIGPVPENQVCAINVQPAPGAIGKRSAVIRIVSNATNAPTLDVPVEMEVPSSMPAIFPISLVSPADQAVGIEPSGMVATWRGVDMTGVRYRVSVCKSESGQDCVTSTAVVAAPK